MVHHVLSCYNFHQPEILAFTALQSAVNTCLSGADDPCPITVETPNKYQTPVPSLHVLCSEVPIPSSQCFVNDIIWAHIHLSQSMAIQLSTSTLEHEPTAYDKSPMGTAVLLAENNVNIIFTLTHTNCAIEIYIMLLLSTEYRN